MGTELLAGVMEGGLAAGSHFGWSEAEKFVGLFEFGRGLGSLGYFAGLVLGLLRGKWIGANMWLSEL